MGLFLKITSLPLESVVSANTVSIAGATNPDAIVSVNLVVVDVDAQGEFTTTLSLERGTNVIQVIASDFQGNQVSVLLTVIYFP